MANIKIDEFVNIYDNYAMSDVWGLVTLQKMEICEPVKYAVKQKGFVDFEKNQFNIPNDLDVSDIELLIDFYIGTILNNISTHFLMTYSLEQALPKEYIAFAELLTKEPLIKWNNLYFATHYTQYNQLVLTYLGSEFNNTNNKFCFNLTSKF